MIKHKPNSDTGTLQRLLRCEDVLSVTGFSSPQRLYNLMNEGLFPRPVKTGPRSVAWVAAEIEEWQRERLAQRPAKFTEKVKNEATADA